MLNNSINTLKSRANGKKPDMVHAFLEQMKPAQAKLKQKVFQLKVTLKYKYMDLVEKLPVPLFLKAEQWYNPFLAGTYIKDLTQSHTLYSLEYAIMYQILESLPKRVNRRLILVSKFFTSFIFKFPELACLDLHYF